MCGFPYRRFWYVSAPPLNNVPQASLKLMSAVDTTPGRRNFTFFLSSKTFIIPACMSLILLVFYCFTFFHLQHLLELQYLLAHISTKFSSVGPWRNLYLPPFPVIIWNPRGHSVISYFTVGGQENKEKHSGWSWRCVWCCGLVCMCACCYNYKKCPRVRSR